MVHKARYNKTTMVQQLAYISLIFFLVVALIIVAQGQDRGVLVSRADGITLVDQQIAITQNRLNQLFGLRAGFLQGRSDSVIVDRTWIPRETQNASTTEN